MLNIGDDFVKQIIDNRPYSSMIDFYNKVTTENMNSFVLVESKGIYNQNKKYSNGVIIGSL